MIKIDDLTCPKCEGVLKYYDNVNRLVRAENRDFKYIKIRRLRCINCESVHRELPNFIFPNKQYDARIIIGVLNDSIFSDTIEYEVYPCEMTMCRWRTQKLHILLWNK